MWKLLVTLAVMKLYAQIDIFKNSPKVYVSFDLNSEKNVQYCLILPNSLKVLVSLFDNSEQTV